MSAKEGVIYCRMDKERKENAEAIMRKGGFTPGNVINLFYHYIIDLGHIPVALRGGPARPQPELKTIEDIRNAILEGIRSAEEDETFTLEEIEELVYSNF